MGALGIILATFVVSGIGHARDVIGDDERDVFVGSGSLILPTGISQSGRATAANCPGCEWKATLACDPVSPTACRGQARLCPNDHFWLAISLKQPGGSWQPIGSQCFGPGGPARRDHVENQIYAQLERAVEPLSPSHRPPIGILPHLPVIFDSGHSRGPHAWTWRILGMDVSVNAQPAWVWQFENNGPITVVNAPGGPRLADGVTHIYRSAGVRDVTVRARWSATFSVGELGPLSVTQPIQQFQQVNLRVGQARAVLNR